MTYGDISSGYGFYDEPPSASLIATTRINSELSTPIGKAPILLKSEPAYTVSSDVVHKAELAKSFKFVHLIKSELTELVYKTHRVKLENATPYALTHRINGKSASQITAKIRANNELANSLTNKTRLNLELASVLRDSIRVALKSHTALSLIARFNQQQALVIYSQTDFDNELATRIYRTQYANFAPITFIFNPVKWQKAVFTIPEKQVYQMQHTITATLENGTPLKINNVKLTLDNDSFAWQFSCDLLDITQVDLVKQTTDTPVILTVTIDGFEFKMLCEKTTESRTFANRRVSLTGRSLSALLTEPYAAQKTKLIDKDLTIQQLASSLLPRDFSLSWSASNTKPWKIPANTYSYTQKTPAQSLVDLAQSIGASAIASRNQKAILLQTKYPVLPWKFETTAPNVVIPDAAILSVSYRNVTQNQANAVYIHGDENGILARVKLKGTAADKLAATQNNVLITHVDAARMLGSTILANNYQQPIIQSITLPFGGDFGMVEVGHFVRIDIDDSQVFGVVNSVAIDANLESVRQTIQLGNESANVWQSFKKVMPQQPLLVGKLSIENDKNIITLKDGGKVVVRGTGETGKNYYIRNNAIESQAPNLVQSEIVI